MLLTLIAPQRPRSVVTRIITARLPSRRTRNGCLYSVARSPTVCRTSIILSAYGRVACTAACALRRRVAATTCIALVIFCVFLIESMRRTMSLYEGICLGGFLDRFGGVRLLGVALDAELVVEGRDGGVEAREQGVVQRFLLFDVLQDAGPLASQEADKTRLPLAHAGDGNLVEVPLRSRVEHRDLLRQRHRLVLVLLEELREARATLELVAGRRVEVGGELREGGQLAVLGEVEAKLARDLAHRLGLGVTAHTRNADADVERGALAGVEEVGLQVDLAVGDGDDVRRNEGRDVVCLRLDHRQRRQ